jgi:hypothetical protein
VSGRAGEMALRECSSCDTPCFIYDHDRRTGQKQFGGYQPHAAIVAVTTDFFLKLSG